MKKFLALILITLTLGTMAQPLLVSAATPEEIAAMETEIDDKLLDLSTDIDYIAQHRAELPEDNWAAARSGQLTNSEVIANLLRQINPNDSDRINRALQAIQNANTALPVGSDVQQNFNNALTINSAITSLIGPERARRSGFFEANANARNFSTGNTDKQISKEKNDLPGCNLGVNNWDIPCAFTFMVAWALNGPIASISAFISWVANSFFNVLIKYTVLDFAKFGSIDQQTGNAALRAGWIVARDLVNIFLIFIILYIAISTILQLGVNVKNTLPKVIAVALLVNFSAFFTGIAIDASNILATQFYYMAGGNNQTPGAGQSNDITTQLHKGLDATMASLKLPGNTVGKSQTEILLGMIPISLGKITLDVITTIIMFFAAGMFLTRFITLIVLIVLSPLAFAATILPKTGNHWNRWTSALISQAFFAPAFLFMFYVTVRLTQQGSIQALANAAQNGNGAGTNLGFVYSVMYALLVNGLMVASLLVAKNLGAEGASAGLGALKKVGNYTRGVLAGTALGGAALGLRGLRAGVQTATNPAAIANIGRGTAGGIRSLFKKDTWTKPIGTVRGVAKAVGSAAITTAATARDAAVSSTIGLAQVGVNSLTKSAAKFDPVARNIARAISPNLSDKDEAKKQREAQEEKEEKQNFTELSAAIRANDPKAIKTVLKKVSDKQIGNMEFADLKKVAENLSGGQLKAATDRKDLTRDQKDQIREARTLVLKQEATEPAPGTTKPPGEKAFDPVAVKDKIGGMKGEDVAKLDKSILTLPEVMKNLTVRHLVKIIDEVAPAEQMIIRQNIENAVAAGTATPQQQNTNTWLNFDSVGKTFGR
jgi:hypothetical protein